MQLRKRTIPAELQSDSLEWLAVEEIAEVDVSSEDPVSGRWGVVV